MMIREVTPKEGFVLHVLAEDGASGDFEVSPFLAADAFAPLGSMQEFKKIRNGRYFVEWECGADLSADTIAARWKRKQEKTQEGT